MYRLCFIVSHDVGLSLSHESLFHSQCVGVTLVTTVATPTIPIYCATLYSQYSPVNEVNTLFNLIFLAKEHE